MCFIVSILALWIIGIFVLLLVSRRYNLDLSISGFLATSFFIGIGFINLILFFYYLLGIKLEFLKIIFVPTICLILFLYYLILQIRNRKINMPHLLNFRNWSFFEKIVLLGILLQICWVFYLTLPMPVNSYDAFLSYALKAKIFYLHKGIPDGFFNWSESVVSNLDYPPLTPFFMVWVYEFTGFNDLIVTKIMPVTYVFLLLLLYFQFKRFFNRKYALLGIFFIATIPQIARYATIIHADFILLSFVTSAFFLCFIFVI